VNAVTAVPAAFPCFGALGFGVGGEHDHCHGHLPGPLLGRVIIEIRARLARLRLPLYTRTLAMVAQ
jgi:hypothetical protein